MDDIQELRRLASPAPRPQSLAWDGTTLWMGSRETRRLYAIEPGSWRVRWETEAPGTPWGMVAVGGELRVLCGETGDDLRIIRRCLPGKGFDADFGLPCPDDTGSQLGYDGRLLHVSQWYRRRVLALGPSGGVERTILAQHGICGQVFVGENLYLATTDDEENGDYWLTRASLGGPEPVLDDVARIPFAARALAFDGVSFWTNHRERDEIVSFRLGDRR